MKFFRKIIFDISVLVICTIETQGALNTYPEVNMTRLLPEWPKVEVLTSDKEHECFDMLWDSNRTLRENQKELVQKFIKTCLDFSFKTTSNEHENMYIGKDETGHILFLAPGNYRYVMKNVDDFSVVDKNGASVKIYANTQTRLLSGIVPLDMNHRIESSIRKSLTKLVRDSVGCELLRVVLTKHITCGMNKISVIPTKRGNVGLEYMPLRNIWQAIKGDSLSEGNYLESRCILFPVSLFIHESEEPLIEKIINDSGERLKVTVGSVPLDASLYRCLAGSLIDKKDNQESESRNVIENRNKLVAARVVSKFEGTVNEKKSAFSMNKKTNDALFTNDLEFRLVFGLTSKGFTLINEAAYSAHKYNYVRCSHIGANSRFSESNKEVSRNDMYRLLINFFNRGYGDNELYMYYLSSNSPINYPEFGKGSYRCLDWN